MNWIGQFLAALLAPLLKLFKWCARVIPFLKHVSFSSVPGRVAMVAFLMLLMFSIMWYFRVDRGGQKLDYTRSWFDIAIVIGLTIGIPICIYYAVKMLREGDVSEYADIDSAWKKGTDALEQYGIELSYTPLFVVLGTQGAAAADQLHNASFLSLEFAQIPGGNSPLQWFAGRDGIFLHLTGCCCLSKLAGQDQGQPAELDLQKQYMRTLQHDPAQATFERPSTRTLAADSDDAPSSWEALSRTPQPGRTLMPGETLQPAGIPKFDPREPAHKPTISTQSLAEYANRLAYVAKLIKRHRYPVCPINGVLTVLPFSLVDSAPDQTHLALRHDLEVLTNETQMRFPATILVSEIEKETGFMEMVRRIGVDSAKKGRFGKGFGSGDTDIWTAPNENNVRALAQLACRAFQDNIYFLYSRRDSLQKTGNGKLYALLNSIRRRFAERLETTLVSGLSNLNVMLTGCYFGATGTSEDQQAFVHSVIGDRVMGNQAKISWNESAANENRRFQSLANLMALTALASFILLVTLIIISLASPPLAASIKNTLWPFGAGG
jgi:hypothetical protein